jgi:site-specific recombinase XerD
MKKALRSETVPYKEWLDLQEKSEVTKQKYIRDVDKFLNALKGDLAAITKIDVLSYKDSLVSQYKPSSVNSFLISLNSYFLFLQRDDLRVKTLKIQRKNSLNNVLMESEYTDLIKTALSRNRIRLYYLIRVLASSGIRIGELQYITVEMLKTGKVEVTGKEKIREIIIPKNLCESLREYCQTRNIRNVIFHGRNTDTMLDKAWIWRELKKLAVDAGVPKEKVYAHNFRHYFARSFLGQFHDIVDLADILGHNSIETTRIYTRTSKQEKQDRIDAMHM